MVLLWDVYIRDSASYAVVTPLRKAASYEQHKTHLGNQKFWRRIITYSATYYAALTRVYPLYRHIGDATVESTDFTWQNFQKASRRPRKGPVTITYCHVRMPYLPRVSHVSPQIPKMAIRGSYEAALGKGVTTA